ncbi:ATP-binding cassette sub-family D member 3 [Maniola jurtina]|uniref:ATP-binding cassette sub-family D member 3 n=1 Tax=Maniola jurtina TaxID=191418 RepID=UPI001E689E06|nr:ATP-binding cassette sub-family D member 3 [Maniola jurtina]XP_045764176.1 ATP-binding cassette sub-family D member 3 [Maniola jurtina]XP_045764177.1 ATP-binding cassette sub-family D member 3 [Maniola jurtina]
MAPNFSKFTSRTDVKIGLAASAALGAWIVRNALKSRKPKNVRKPGQLSPEERVQYMIKDKDRKGPKAQVDARFFAELKALWHIMVPGLWTKESAFMVLIALSLIARTLCDLWLIQHTTLVEGSIITMNLSDFRRLLGKFFMAMPLISLVNNVLKWSIGEVKLRLRTNLSLHLYQQYLKGFTYYQLTNLDNRISNADQLLTTDIDKFCDTVIDLYSNISKPMLDISIYLYRLTVNLGASTPGIMMAYLFFSGIFLTYLRKPTARMTVQEQKLEGEFRYVNSRLITNSEEIAFYQGNHREQLTILASFYKLTRHLRNFLNFRVGMGFIDNIVAKYIAITVGFYAVSRPFFVRDHNLLTTGTEQDRFRHYYTYGRMLVKMAEGIGRLVLSGRELSKLAGLTARVTQLKNVLEDVNRGNYSRTMVERHSNGTVPLMTLTPGAGRIIYQDKIIRFDRVPLVTPNGDVLIKELTFEVKSGINVLVCGPNGCGKSSMFRMLGELWPIFGGTLTKPPKGKLFYVPQRPYMTLGTFRDQVIYPQTREEMLRRGRTDEELNRFLDIVQLSYLTQREGGWDAVEDWMDVLSGGEKQRIAMARLFYHAPQFAILDECTSAVSVDVEGHMYQYCREMGISLFTVSHRKSLWRHHDHYLQMDGRGSYVFEEIDTDTQEFGS